MRRECQYLVGGGECGKPASEYMDSASRADGRYYLCAEHWDELTKAIAETPGSVVHFT
jgi:hypothetical protein